MFDLVKQTFDVLSLINQPNMGSLQNVISVLKQNPIVSFHFLWESQGSNRITLDISLEHEDLLNRYRSVDSVRVHLSSYKQDRGPSVSILLAWMKISTMIFTCEIEANLSRNPEASV